MIVHVIKLYYKTFIHKLVGKKKSSNVAVYAVLTNIV